MAKQASKPILENSKNNVPESLSTSIGFLLNRNAAIIKERVTATLLPLGLSPRDVGLLKILEAEGPLTQQALGKRHNIDRTTTVQLIDELEKRSLAIRCNNPNDKRSHLLYITPRGKKTLAKALKLTDKEQSRFMAPLSENDWKSLQELLLKLLNHHYS